MSRRKFSRRQFVAGTGQAAMAAMIVPRHVLGGVGFRAPSDILNVAIVGAGGQGMNNAEQLVSENIMALCDVDFGYVERQLAGRGMDGNKNPRPNGLKLQEQFGKAKRYADFREMLDKEKGIDGLVIATPDHAHAAIAKAAMELKKAVYVQKPLTATVGEARMLKELARTTGVVTQMGNQGHSTTDARLINEWIQAGLIGTVREVHIFTNRPIWPQGLVRPAVPPTRTPPTPPPAGVPAGPPQWNQTMVNDAMALGMWSANVPVPDTLNWDLYHGPIANKVPYHPIYHPFNWRGWTDFGAGALGDMGAHLIDAPFWALGLGLPSSIEATSTPWGGGSRTPASFPQATTVHYEFPATADRPGVKLNWFDGGLMPPRPDGLPDDFNFNREGQVIFIGDKGLLLHETYGLKPQLFPRSLQERTASIPAKYPRIETSHEMNWANAAKGIGQASSPFEHAATLTEVMLLGLVALRTGQGRKILYDGANMKVTNAPEANQYLTREYRAGWGL
jgi:predicted dehydrogenase